MEYEVNGVAKAFVRKWDSRTGIWLLSDSNVFDLLENESIYAFGVNECGGAILLSPLGCRDATQEAVGLTPTQVRL